MKAVILAAGRGTRLLPLTEKKPKHLIPIGGSPLLEWLLKSVRRAGINEAIVITHYFDEQIRNYFGDGSKLGLKIKYLKQKEIRGTADAFMKAKEHIDDFFVGVYGDLYLSLGVIKKIVNKHKSNMILTSIKVENPSRYGIVELKEGRVTRIVEKPKPGTEPSCLTNAGIYVFPYDVFNYIRDTDFSPRGEIEITDTIQAMINDGIEIRAVEISLNEWRDVGLPWNILEANSMAMRSIKNSVKGDVEKGARIIEPVIIKKGARIRSGAYIEGPVFIDADSDVGPNCYLRPYTYLGKRTRVGNACEIKNSVVMDDTNIAHLSYIGDSVLGERCNLGAGSITANLRFDKKDINVTIKGQKLDSERNKLGAFIGDDSQTGIDVSIWPGVKIGSGSWVAPGVTVTKDLPSNTYLDSNGKEIQINQ